MKGPTSAGFICNAKGKEECPYLDAWYNGGMSVHGRCKKGVWQGIKSWEPGGGCETPKRCSLLKA
ncbi:hypothetical protein LCGC14_1594330 [marine sediment metagenome]|uniref:Uncharacterized protein n=1 Tax=marine sediment metagenome TaxID=412755 RepID=A0A0F9IZH5_9ZZZZ